MVEITDEWLHQHCSNPARTSWTAAQLKLIGVSWPPVGGWKGDVLGMLITSEVAGAFARAATEYRPQTLKRRRKRERREQAMRERQRSRYE